MDSAKEFVQAYKERFIEQMQHAGMTWKELATALGYKRYQNISNKIYEGTLRIPEERKIARLLGYRVVWLSDKDKERHLSPTEIPAILEDKRLGFLQAWQRYTKTESKEALAHAAAAWESLYTACTLLYIPPVAYEKMTTWIQEFQTMPNAPRFSEYRLILPHPKEPDASAPER